MLQLIWESTLSTGPSGPLRIMSLGDSITVGAGTYTSYRVPLGSRLRSRAIDYAFVGEFNDVMTAEASQFSALNGVKAQTVADLYIKTWVENVSPDVILMHLGTNDLNSNVPVDEITRSIEEIITEARVVKSNIVFYSSIIGIDNYYLNNIVNQLNESLKTNISKMDTSLSLVYIVDQYTGFEPTMDIYDTVHPNVNGQYKISEKWFSAIAEAGIIGFKDELFNIAFQKPMSLSEGPYTAYDTSLVVDDKLSDPHFLRVAPSQSYVVSLGGDYLIYYIELVHFGYFSSEMATVSLNTKSYRIDVSNDSSSWSTIAHVADNNRGRTTHVLLGVEASFVKLDVLIPNDYLLSNEFRLRQIRIMGKPKAD